MAGIRRAADAIRQFAGPADVDQLLRLERAAEQLRASGAATDEVERAIAAAQGMFSPEDIRIGRILKALEQEATFPQSQLRPMTLNAMDVPPAAAMSSFEDMAPDIARSARSYDGLWAAGRPEPGGGTANLRNQPHAKAAGLELRAAAQDSIRGQQEALASENLGRAAATAGVGGLAAMIAESTGRMTPSPAGIGDLESVAEAPELAPAPRVEDIVLPDVPIDLPEAMDPPDMYAVKNIARDLPLEQIDLLNDDPMATADLVEESRPTPASTPRVSAAPLPSPKPALTSQQAAEQFLADARAQIDRLNSYRRSGQINPQVDRQMSQEIERMLQLANEARSGR